MRKRFCLLPVLALALLCACSKGAAKTPPTRPADFTSTERQFNPPADGDTIAIFDTSLGEVRAVLYPDAAPMAVYNFVGLARSGYYDNTTIWRSEYGFAGLADIFSPHRRRTRGHKNRGPHAELLGCPGHAPAVIAVCGRNQSDLSQLFTHLGRTQ